MPPARLSIAREVHQVPRHERRVAPRELVLEPAAARVGVARPRAGLADPSAVGLRRDHVAEVLQRVQHVHRDVLDAVLVARDDHAADAAVVDPLALVVQLAGVAVQALDHARADARLVAEPDRRADDEDVGGEDPLLDRRPVVAREAVLGHVGLHARARCRGRPRGPPRRATPCARMIAIELSISACVFDGSGERLSVQLTYTARRSEKSSSLIGQRSQNSSLLWA